MITVRPEVAMIDAKIADSLRETEGRLRAAHATHLGYPYNLTGRSPIPSGMAELLINNLGDPYAGSHFASEVCGLELQAIEWLQNLWEAGAVGETWGSIGASGTEGNLWAIYLGREALPSAVLIHSEEAHYSIPKAARLLRIETRSVRCLDSGAIDVTALGETLATVNARPVIVVLTCGTTMKGAHDDVAAVMNCLDVHGFRPGKRFVHLDGALNAMVLPFLEGVPDGLMPTFRHQIDSISTSGHKMIGTPMPCGVLIAQKKHVDRVASSVAYLRSNDTTLMGSRNGHAVVAVWARLFGYGQARYAEDARRCVEKAQFLAGQLAIWGAAPLWNPYGMTVVFPEPEERIVNRYQLACYRGQAHAIIMPNVTDDLIQEFLEEYLCWWRRSGFLKIERERE
ncbi:MAG: histidine decarboxylase [Beijerinckiaceae bacterium]